MIYLDTSCLIKLFLPEPETQAVAAAIGRERVVIISSLAVWPSQFVAVEPAELVASRLRDRIPLPAGEAFLACSASNSATSASLAARGQIQSFSNNHAFGLSATGPTTPPSSTASSP